MRIKQLPTVERLNEEFEYRSEEGEIYRRRSSGLGRKGAKAGGITPYGYRFALINCTSYQLHRIIWKMHYGTEPLRHIDHIDGNKLNNRVDNLREATVSENLFNSKIRSDSTTGIKGISYDGSPKRRKRWRAVIMVDQKFIQVGRFLTKEEAVTALDEARDRLHGEFARAA